MATTSTMSRARHVGYPERHRTRPLERPGTERGHARRSCNPMLRISRLWILIVIGLGTSSGRLSAAAEPDRRPTGRLIGAYYYPWYDRERWTREPVAHTPELGRYRSDDRTVA